jgi:GNAT superfamily N-acetyltransferase
VLVIDAYQERGIGSLLLAALSRHAAHHGVDRFRGYVLEDNRPFLDYLRALGAAGEATEEGVVRVDLPVYARADDVPRTPETTRAIWAWHTLDQAEEGGC